MELSDFCSPCLCLLITFECLSKAENLFINNKNIKYILLIYLVQFKVVII